MMVREIVRSIIALTLLFTPIVLFFYDLFFFRGTESFGAWGDYAWTLPGLVLGYYFGSNGNNR